MTPTALTHLSALLDAVLGAVVVDSIVVGGTVVAIAVDYGSAVVEWATPEAVLSEIAEAITPES